MLNLDVSPDAYAEIDDAVTYLNAQSVGLGDEFYDALSAAIDEVRRSPNNSLPGDYGTRMRKIAPFRYLLVFEQLDDVLQVIAVVHERQRPGYWRSRTTWDD